MFENLKWVHGTNLATNTQKDRTVIAAPGADKRLWITKINVMVITAATGDGGTVIVEDGVNGEALVELDADAVGGYSFDLGPRGWPLSLNTLLNVTVSSAGTTEATARCTAFGYEA